MKGKEGLVGYPQLSHLTLNPKVQNPSSGGRKVLLFQILFVCLCFFKLCFKLFSTRSPSIHVLLFTNQGKKKKKRRHLERRLTFSVVVADGDGVQHDPVSVPIK